MRNAMCYATPSDTRRTPTIILAIDAEELPNIDEHVGRYLKRNYSVVVLVGNRFSVDPLLPGEPIPDGVGKVSAQPAWQWCADFMPFARDVVFIPDTHPMSTKRSRQQR